MSHLYQKQLLNSFNFQQNVQHRVRDDLREALEKNEGSVTYEMITTGLPYLNLIIKEVTRMHSSLPFLDRICYPPTGELNYNMDPFSKFKIPTGMPIFIPIHSIQHDPQHFPEPDKFDPSRFDTELHAVNESASIPFGLGARSCIGRKLCMCRVHCINF